MKKFLVIGLVMLLGLPVAGCGDSESTTTSSVKQAQDTTAEESHADPGPLAKLDTGPPEVADPGDWSDLKQLTAGYPNEPVIPRGPAPEHAVSKDLKPGKGPVLGEGDWFLIRWKSYAYKDGRILENLWRTPSKYSYGRYVPAWEVGLEGIRIGTVRELIAPSRLAYGEGARVYVVQPVKLEKLE